MTHRTADLIAALHLALPYEEKVAATLPTTNSRMARKVQAARDARAIRKVLDAHDPAIGWATLGVEVAA